VRNSALLSNAQSMFFMPSEFGGLLFIGGEITFRPVRLQDRINRFIRAHGFWRGFTRLPNRKNGPAQLFPFYSASTSVTMAVH